MNRWADTCSSMWNMWMMLRRSEQKVWLLLQAWSRRTPLRLSRLELECITLEQLEGCLNIFAYTCRFPNQHSTTFMTRYINRETTAHGCVLVAHFTNPQAWLLLRTSRCRRLIFPATRCGHTY